MLKSIFKSHLIILLIFEILIQQILISQCSWLVFYLMSRLMPTLLLVLKHLATEDIRFFSNTIETLLFGEITDVKLDSLVLFSVGDTEVIPLGVAATVCVWSHV